jgi:hypothetical protein
MISSELPILHYIAFADYLDSFRVNRFVVRQQSFAFLNHLGSDAGQFA